MQTIFIILFLVSAYGTSHILSQMIRNKKCLSDKTISDFMLNRLSEQERSTAITHLGICEDCQNRLHDHNSA